VCRRSQETQRRAGERVDAPLTREAWLALPELRADYDHPDQDAWDSAVRASPRVGAYYVIERTSRSARGHRGRRARPGARLRKAVEAAAALGYAVEPDARIAAKSSSPPRSRSGAGATDAPD
jgi:hypothetical protein